MKIKIPGQSISLRFFEPVETVDDSYHIVDVGLEYDEGGIDSVAVGVATHTATTWYNDSCAADERRKAKKAAKKAAKRERKDSEVATE